jgi:hypothetical protein
VLPEDFRTDDTHCPAEEGEADQNGCTELTRGQQRWPFRLFAGKSKIDGISDVYQFLGADETAGAGRQRAPTAARTWEFADVDRASVKTVQSQLPTMTEAALRELLAVDLRTTVLKFVDKELEKLTAAMEAAVAAVAKAVDGRQEWLGVRTFPQFGKRRHLRVKHEGRIERAVVKLSTPQLDCISKVYRTVMERVQTDPGLPACWTAFLALRNIVQGWGVIGLQNRLCKDPAAKSPFRQGDNPYLCIVKFQQDNIINSIMFLALGLVSLPVRRTSPCPQATVIGNREIMRSYGHRHPNVRPRPPSPPPLMTDRMNDGLTGV